MRLVEQTDPGSARFAKFDGCTPLQLAMLDGNPSMFKHILKKQCDVLWVWGPVRVRARVCVCTKRGYN